MHAEETFLGHSSVKCGTSWSKNQKRRNVMMFFNPGEGSFGMFPWCTPEQKRSEVNGNEITLEIRRFNL